MESTMSNQDRLQWLGVLLSYRLEPPSFAQICERALRDNKIWQNSNTPRSRKAIEREVREMLRSHPEQFVAVNRDQWRNRRYDHCSFCLAENVYVVANRGHRICFDCAQRAVDQLRDKKLMTDQIASNEAAILRGDEIIGA